MTAIAIGGELARRFCDTVISPHDEALRVNARSNRKRAS